MMPLTPAAASGSRPDRRAASALAEPAASAPRGVLGGRVVAEALVLRLSHGEKALRRLDRGTSVSDRGLERPLLRKEALAHGNEALQLLAALVRRPLSPQDEGERHRSRARASAARRCGARARLAWQG